MARRILGTVFAGFAALAVLATLPAASANDDDDWKDRDDDGDYYRDYDRDRDYRGYRDYDDDDRDYRRSYFDDEDDDGVEDDDDICPQTNLPDDLRDDLGRDRFAILNNDGVFETRDRDYYRYGDFLTIDDTGGCSCDQIIDALDLGEEAQERGCREQDLDRWMDRIYGD